MKKIYFNNRFIGIADLNDCPITEDVEQIVVTEYKDIPNLIKYFEENLNIGCLVLKSFDKKALFREFASNFVRIDAAGGVVFNAANEILLINRLGKWDLPKGKVEKNEKIENAAVREVEEECGISDVILDEWITNTFHVYPYKGSLVLKKTYWYRMRYEGMERLIPQTEEDITDAVWVKTWMLNDYMENTYETIRAVIGELSEKF